MTSDTEHEFPTSVMVALTRGQKITAIKLLREAKGIGLKESKEIVDAYIASRPELKARFAAANAEWSRKFVTFVVFLALLSSIGYWLFIRET